MVVLFAEYREKILGEEKWSDVLEGNGERAVKEDWADDNDNKEENDRKDKDMACYACASTFGSVPDEVMEDLKDTEPSFER